MLDKKLAMKDLKDVMAVFKRYNVPAFLSYGAVLGAVRDGGLIPWDDDLDIDVVDKCNFETRKRIGHTLLDLGFMPQPITFNVFGRMELSEPGYNGDGETGIIVCQRNVPFSIFFYKQEGDEMVCTPKTGSIKLISNLAKFYDNPAEVKLYGEKFKTPGPLKEYLTYMYGDWKKPVEGFHAPQYKQRHV